MGMGRERSDVVWSVAAVVVQRLRTVGVASPWPMPARLGTVDDGLWGDRWPWVWSGGADDSRCRAPGLVSGSEAEASGGCVEACFG